MSVREETRTKTKTVLVTIDVITCDGPGCTAQRDLEYPKGVSYTPPGWIGVSYAVAGSDSERSHRDFCSHECLSKGLKV